METTTDSANLDLVARQVRLPVEKVQATVELLDEGNTVPFVTRYRKDRTGGLDEEQIRQIQEAVSLQRQLGERKQKILRSIQSQNQLTEALERKISAASSLKTLEDLYLPFRPKKQTLATVAKQRGLEPLALEVLNASGEVEDLESRCATFVNPEKQLATAADVLTGVGHILAEMLGERADLRAIARKRMWDGTLVSKRIENADELAEDHDGTDQDTSAEDHGGADLDTSAESAHETPDFNTSGGGLAEAEQSSPNPAATEPAATEPAATEPAATEPAATEPAATESAEQETPNSPVVGTAAESASIAPPPVVSAEESAAAPDDPENHAESKTVEESSSEPKVDAQLNSDQQAVTEVTAAAEVSTEQASHDAQGTTGVSNGGGGPEAVEVKKEVAAVDVADGPAGKSAKIKAAEDRRIQRREARRRKRQKLEQSFKDYFDYSEPISRLPHYRVLAINRGERCKVLRVKISFDSDGLRSESDKLVVPEGHPYAQQMRDSLHDALNRLVVPSIDREIRRELTDRAEIHAVKVFAQNLRKLLLQPPLHHHRVLAIDPGFRSGCKLVAMDEFGNVLSHTLIHVIGAAERVQHSRQRLIEQIREHQITVVAIGNGTASRETEQLVAQVMTEELSDVETKYLMVNEAGASVYSTSQTGREELPKYDASVRGAVSIGRRALDPLSELVKIDPANIGVGLYQHDIKAKHLRTSLDAVVESCVNYVGVDVNSASPALLGYVSGLNQLTARRLYEYRLEHGPFRNREQLKLVPGIGEATYVQAAGFLKIPGAENPLDETWIHPESYQIARSVLDEIGGDVASLSTRAPTVPPAATDGFQVSELTGARAIDANPTESSNAEQSAAEQAETAAADPGPTSESTETASDPSASEVTETSTDVAPQQPLAQPSEIDAVSVDPANEQAEATVPVSQQPEAAQQTEAAQQPEAPVETPVRDPAAAATSVEPTASQQDSESAAADSNSLAEQLMQIDVSQLAEKLSVGKLLLTDIMASLARPGRDPREDLSPPVFRREILKIENLKAGMKFSGAVLNVVDFGAFVDIGLTDSGLIHVSRLADRFVSDPHDVVSVGDILDVWVVEVDGKRRRVSLTAIEPGTEKPRPARPQKSTEQAAPEKRRRPPRPKTSEKRPQKAGSRGKGPRDKASWKPKKKPKPVVPITDAMAEGTEPMRTFSDLLQFHTRKQDDDESENKSDKKKSSK